MMNYEHATRDDFAITRVSFMQRNTVNMDVTCFLQPIKSNAVCGERDLRGLRHLLRDPTPRAWKILISLFGQATSVRSLR